MTLYEIDKAITEAFESAVDEDGVIIDEEAVKRLNALEIERDEKCENIALFIKNLQAEANAVKEEKLKMAARQTALEHKIESLKRYLMYALDGQKFNTARVLVSYRTAEQTQITNIDALPREYLRFADPEPDKAKIKNAIKSGHAIPGAEVITSRSVIIK